MLQDILRQGAPAATPDEFVEDTPQRMQEISFTVFAIVDPETGDLRGSIPSYEIVEMIYLTAASRDF